MEPLLSMPYLPNLDGSSERRPIGSGRARPAPERGFRDRRAAGRELARALAGYVGRSDVSILALSCGGVPVACEVARALGAPLDACLEREPGGPRPDVRGKTIILVDDGLAPVARVTEAVVALRQVRPGRVIVAIPAAAPETCAEVSSEADELVCARPPVPFYAAGLWYLWYHDSTPPTDEDVRDLLAHSRTAGRRWDPPPASRLPMGGPSGSAEAPAGAGNQADIGPLPTS
jgi:putative phosphoribosyl transferase